VSVLSRLSPRDLERLSAYVDGALSPRQHEKLEKQLAADADLRLGLAELRSVKASLAGLPERRVPRNFTLRLSEAPRRSAAFPALRFATVLATGLFVLTTAIRTLPLSFSLGASAPAPMFALEAQATEEAAQVTAPEAGAELQAEAPPLAAAESAMATPAPPGTPTPAATPCAECPTMDTTARAAGEVAQPSDQMTLQVAAEPARFDPWTAAQWLLGSVAVVLAVLTVRARRR